ncbi:MAG: hypothetical protein K2I03_04030 [Lachnospiraceae bacterium]|nr:hypothetical protein [Lachnospiraceae bacterium]MDE6232114.1 hypothetical protein [Lachnospiraceae bacterium]MDE6252962.1 hypothetical protein [Lachnospiraceae bacterium]
MDIVELLFIIEDKFGIDVVDVENIDYICVSVRWWQK